MPRPCCRRQVAMPPDATGFRPVGVRGNRRDEIVLALDEFEAIRLADLEGLYQEQAAERMGVSRQTFGRIVAAGRRKVAEALVAGNGLRIEGGEVETAMRVFKCTECGHVWELAFGTGRPTECPSCRSANLHRHESQRGPCCPGRGGRGRGRHRGGRGQGRGFGPPVEVATAPAETKDQG